MTNAEKIKNLLNIVYNELDEEKLLSESDGLLNSLRIDWRTNSGGFSDKDIEILKKTTRQVESIRRFSEEVEELPYLEYKEDVDEVMKNLFSIIESIDDLQIALRVKKEIRELTEKRKNLPNQFEIEAKQIKYRAVSELESKLKSCKKCGAIMVIRETKNSYFWGCPNFPNCWYKSPLKKEELDVLNVR